MPTSGLLPLIYVVLTLLYMLIGIRALLAFERRHGLRWLPKTAMGTYASIVFWPIFIVLSYLRIRFGRNRWLV